MHAIVVGDFVHLRRGSETVCRITLTEARTLRLDLDRIDP